MAAGGTERIWPTHATAAGRSAVAAARQGWRGDGLGPGQAGRVCPGRPA